MQGVVDNWLNNFTFYRWTEEKEKQTEEKYLLWRNSVPQIDRISKSENTQLPGSWSLQDVSNYYFYIFSKYKFK